MYIAKSLPEKVVSRTANYAILGYQYQFQKTLLEILEADDDDVITVEGAVEDIERIDSHGNVESTQCKYHTSADGYRASAIFSPILHMMSHFAGDPSAGQAYTLYVHFPNQSNTSRNLHAAEARKALASKNCTYRGRIDGIQSNVTSSSTFDTEEDFVQKFCELCTIEFGESIEDLEVKNMDAFRETHLASDSIDTLYLPNGIQSIVRLSTQENVEDRQVSRRQFLNQLAEIRTVAISKWTLALKSRRKILEAKRKQMQQSLGQDSRERAFFLSDRMLRMFDVEIVKFIKAFVDKYHVQKTHRHTPTFLLDCNRELFNEICKLFRKKRIHFEDGMVGEEFSIEKFRQDFKYSLNTKPEEMFFRLRLTCICWTTVVLIELGLDDLYVVGNATDIALPPEMSVDIEYLSIDSFDELKYLLGLSKYVPEL